MKGLARLDAPARLPGVDLARGLAVLGMFAAHLLVTPEFAVSDPSTWLGVVDGRSSILFATLAGVSIGLLTGGPRPVRGAALRIARGRLMVRAALLWSIGVMLIATRVPIIVILPAYAVLFVLTLPFLTLPARILLPLAAGVGLVTPFLLAPIEDAAGPALRYGAEPWILLGWQYPFVVWIAFVLAGLGLARAGLFRVRVQVVALAGGTALAVLGYGLASALPADPDTGWGAVWTAEAHSSGVLEVVGSGGFAIAVIALCCLTCRTVLSRVALPLRAVGSMPLTAYTVQILAWWLVALAVVGDPQYRETAIALGLFWYIAIGVTLGCTVWALLVGRGPLEYLVDQAARIIVPRAASAPARERTDA